MARGRSQRRQWQGWATESVSHRLAERWRKQGWALPALVESLDDRLLVVEILRAYLRSKKGTKTVEKYLDSMPRKRSAKLRDSLPELKDHAEKPRHSTAK